MRVWGGLEIGSKIAVTLTAWKRHWNTLHKPRPPSESHTTRIAVRTPWRTASSHNRGAKSSIAPNTATNRRWQRRLTRVPGWLSRTPRRARIATLISRHQVFPFAVRGCGRNGTITPSAPITSGSASSSAVKGSTAGGVPPPPTPLPRPRAALSPVAPPAGPPPRACPPPALPRSTAAVIGGPSHTAQILPTDNPSTELPPPCVGGAPTPTLDPPAQPASPCSPSDTVLPAAASRSPQTTYAAFAAGSLYSAATAYNARRRAIAPAVGHARLSSLPSAGPPTAALPPKPPAPSAPSSQLPAPVLAVLETGGHSHLTYRLSVTKGCPLLGLVSKKNITSCHAPEPPPPTLRYAR